MTADDRQLARCLFFLLQQEIHLFRLYRRVVCWRGYIFLERGKESGGSNANMRAQQQQRRGLCAMVETEFCRGIDLVLANVQGRHCPTALSQHWCGTVCDYRLPSRPDDKWWVVTRIVGIILWGGAQTYFENDFFQCLGQSALVQWRNSVTFEQTHGVIRGTDRLDFNGPKPPQWRKNCGQRQQESLQLPPSTKHITLAVQQQKPWQNKRLALESAWRKQWERILSIEVRIWMALRSNSMRFKKSKRISFCLSKRNMLPFCSYRKLD